MTSNNIITLARNKLLETTTEILKDDVLYIYANLSQEDIAKKTFTNDKIKSATVAFSSGVGSLPTDFGTLYGDAFDTANNFYPEMTIEDFKKETLSYGVTIEAGTIKVLPNTVASLTIKYWPTFADMTSAVNPSIPTYFHECIVYGILYRAFEDLQDWELSKFFREKYESELKQKIETMSNYEENNVRSSQMFSAQNLLDNTSYL
jgi:hypothetical protein